MGLNVSIQLAVITVMPVLLEWWATANIAKTLTNALSTTVAAAENHLLNVQTSLPVMNAECVPTDTKETEDTAERLRSAILKTADVQRWPPAARMEIVFLANA